MMYKHTITVYDSKTMKLVKTIQDAIDPARFHIKDHGSDPIRGAPVEAAFLPDGRFAYVSQYSMYGPGYVEGHDAGSPGRASDSYIYRVYVADLADRQDHQGRRGAQVRRRHPRLQVRPGQQLGVVHSQHDRRPHEQGRQDPLPRPVPARHRRLAQLEDRIRGRHGHHQHRRRRPHRLPLSWISGVGAGPRHLCMAGNGKYLYATLNSEGNVAKIDPKKRVVVDKVYTGSEPRSMAIAPDGKSLFVVNYNSSTMSQVRTSDMKVIHSVGTNSLPIGITYDAPTRSVWLCCYTGSIMIFKQIEGEGTVDFFADSRPCSAASPYGPHRDGVAGGASAARAEDTQDYLRALQAVADLRAYPPEVPLVCLLGGSSPRSSTVSDLALTRQIRNDVGYKLVAFNLGSRNRLLTTDRRLVGLLPDVHPLVYIGIYMGGSAAGTSTRRSTSRLRLGAEPPVAVAGATTPCPTRASGRWSPSGCSSAGRRSSGTTGTSSACSTARSSSASREASIPVIIDLPRNMAIMGHQLDRPLDIYHAGCRAIAKRNGIPYVQLQNQVAVGNGDFRDIWHLLPDSRIKWQTQLSAMTALLMKRYDMGATPSPSPSPSESPSAAPQL